MLLKSRPWHTQARPAQLPPADGDWRVYLMQVGRGWGATRASAEWIAEQAATHPNTEWAIVAPTWAEVRKICFEGSSGVLKALLPGELESHSNLDLRIRLTNGSVIRGFSAGYLVDFRGHEFAGAWLDNTDGCRHVIDDVWSTVSESVSGQIVVTATPLSHGWPWLEDLAAQDDTIRVIGSTWDNANNLSPVTLAELRKRYEGTPMVEGA